MEAITEGVGMIRKFWAMLLALGVTLAISLGVTFGAAPGLAMADEDDTSDRKSVV